MKCSSKAVASVRKSYLYPAYENPHLAQNTKGQVAGKKSTKICFQSQYRMFVPQFISTARKTLKDS